MLNLVESVFVTSPTTSFELTDLLGATRAAARSSLAFLAQRVLALDLSDARCAALQRDPQACSPLSLDEVRALRVFHSLRKGEEPHGLSDLERQLVA